MTAICYHGHQRVYVTIHTHTYIYFYMYLYYIIYAYILLLITYTHAEICAEGEDNRGEEERKHTPMYNYGCMHKRSNNNN